jgi:hypothetical protein
MQKLTPTERLEAVAAMMQVAEDAQRAVRNRERR